MKFYVAVGEVLSLVSSAFLGISSESRWLDQLFQSAFPYSRRDREKQSSDRTIKSRMNHTRDSYAMMHEVIMIFDSQQKL